MNEYKPDVIPVFWKCLKTKVHTFAGVAFFNPEKGTYRLKVSTFSNKEIYYLNPKAAQNNQTYFELEKVITNSDGKVVKKFKVSECVGSKFVEITIPPFSGYKLTMRFFNENK